MCIFAVAEYHCGNHHCGNLINNFGIKIFILCSSHAPSGISFRTTRWRRGIKIMAGMDEVQLRADDDYAFEGDIADDGELLL